MIQGCWTALITPFNKDGSLDEAGLRENIRYQIANGINGITALGSTGESATLTSDEQEKIVAICKEFDVPLMVGTGTNNTATTIQKTQWAKERGADVALVVTPYYNKPPQEGIYQHFMAVANAVDIPIVVYNIRGRSGVNIETDTLRRIAEHPRIVGVKESSGDINQITDVLATIPKLKMISGDDIITYPLLALGGHGLISVVGNLIPDLMCKLVNGKLDESRKLHFELLELFKASMMETNPIPIKAMMRLADMPAGECRLPLCPPQPKTMEKLQWLVETLTSRL